MRVYFYQFPCPSREPRPNVASKSSREWGAHLAGSVLQRFDNGQIRVLQPRVLADEGDAHANVEGVNRVGHSGPFVEVWCQRLPPPRSTANSTAELNACSFVECQLFD